jgi:hypothetical protein
LDEAMGLKEHHLFYLDLLPSPSGRRVGDEGAAAWHGTFKQINVLINKDLK